MAQPISRPYPPERREPVGDRWFWLRELWICADGAVRPSRWGWPGIGFSIYTHREVLIEAQGREGTSARAMGINCTEAYAAAMALRRARELLGPRCVVLHSDSQLVVDLANGRCRAHDVGLQRAFAILKLEIGRHTWVQTVKVPRDHKLMREADKLSKNAAANRRYREEGRYDGPAIQVREGREVSDRARLRENQRARQRRSLVVK
jgi:ribonuclease HI